MNIKGKLIALEGIDNAGKTTQMGRLERYYSEQGIDIVTTKELTSPIGSFTKKSLYSYRLTPLLKTLLFASDRAIRYEKIVLPALKEGFLVIADRWKLSARVYRAMEDYDTEFVEQVNAKIPDADLTVLLDIPVKVAVKWGKKSNRPVPYTTNQLQRVRNLYLKYSEENNIPIVRAFKTPNAVFEGITKVTSVKLP